jgi:two-component system LytT family response regulator
MTGLKTLIVDDESIARQVLREELEQMEEIVIVGEVPDGASALAAIDQFSPDLVFLDLKMPVLDGFDVIRKLKPGKNIPVIVVVTAFDQHALQAFDAGAIDYLLKPVTPERLAQSVARAVRLRERADAVAGQFAQMQELAGSQHAGSPRRIVARSGDEYLLLNSEEVFAFEADGDVVWIITARKRYLATQTLKTLQEKLRNSSFRRIHRNALVNIDHVRKMSTLTSQRWLITLSNDLEFVVSKRQASTVKGLLSF